MANPYTTNKLRGKVCLMLKKAPHDLTGSLEAGAVFLCRTSEASCFGHLSVDPLEGFFIAADNRRGWGYAAPVEPEEEAAWRLGG